MAFNKEQQGHKDLREIIAQKTRQVVVFVGAGLSAQQPANLPVWPQLRQSLLDDARAKAETLDPNEKKKRESLIQVAEDEENFWRSFSLLKTALGETSYTQNIRRAFSKADDCNPPPIYTSLWRLGITGMITVNIDRFAGRAFADAFQGGALSEFNGFEVGNYIHTFQAGKAFVANLHGTLQNDSSWVFTSEDLNRLQNASLKHFFSLCFSSRVMLFVGVSADDFAIADHLRRLREQGIRFGAHYWITHRNDRDTDAFAEANGLIRIVYSKSAGNHPHSELNEFVEDIQRYISHDPPAPIVIPDAKPALDSNISEPESLNSRSSEEIRSVLNQEALRILQKGNGECEKDYELFTQKYDECIYRAWHITHRPPNNLFFGYRIVEHISRGSFGNVYKAIAPDGTQVAIKVLHENVRDNRLMLDGFRRGVHAMQILARRNISGIVSYKKSWEIPACTVMDYVDGYSLEQAVEARFVTSWTTKMFISLQLITILQDAHSIPEHVLHRDVRPPNIMLRNFQSPDDDGDWEVVMLDFDLCWHKEASGNSVDPDSITIAYHAPEQFKDTEKASRRSALVDSFGIGMTLFFLMCGSHPQPYIVQNDEAWITELKWKIAKLSSPIWRSLPNRLARLIYWATRHDQQSRWDLTKIYGELARLANCLTASQSHDPELIAEEIAARSERMLDYDWNPDHSKACVVTLTGFEFSMWGNEGARKIEGSISWSNQGDRDYSTVRNYLLPKVDKVVSELKQGGWGANITTRRYDQVKVDCWVELSKADSKKDMEKLASSFSAAAAWLKLT